MRYGIFSDVHSNLEALEAVIQAFKLEAIDKYLCVGDVVGYAAQPNECIENVKTLASITVAGNHDWASANLFSIEYFNEMAASAIYWTKQKLNAASRYFLESLKLVYKNEDLTLVHGTLNNPAEFHYLSDGYIAEEAFGLMQANICFVGHTHKVEMFMKDKDGYIHYRRDGSINIREGNLYIINVGSVGQPRDGNPGASYAIYDTEKKEVQIKRINYDTALTRKKIILGGLPQFFGDRLFIAR